MFFFYRKKNSSLKSRIKKQKGNPRLCMLCFLLLIVSSRSLNKMLFIIPNTWMKVQRYSYEWYLVKRDFPSLISWRRSASWRKCSPRQVSPPVAPAMIRVHQQPAGRKEHGCCFESQPTIGPFFAAAGGLWCVTLCLCLERRLLCVFCTWLDVTGKAFCVRMWDSRLWFWTNDISEHFLLLK